ncbi:MAG TPA: 30S ribosomal protein S17 [Guyparkeria sp.]|nr:30S ribosomal protein S17 [Guyparkeria sp.]
MTTVSEENNVRTRQGVVVSDKGDKSITVAVERRVQHSLYGKYLTRTSKLRVHDEENSCRQGDRVEIRETRPISKTKSWTLVRVLVRSAE